MTAFNIEALLFTKVNPVSRRATKASVEVPKNVDPNGHIAAFLANQHGANKMAFTDDNLVDYGEFVCSMNKT